LTPSPGRATSSPVLLRAGKDRRDGVFRRGKTHAGMHRNDAVSDPLQPLWTPREFAFKRRAMVVPTKVDLRLLRTSSQASVKTAPVRGGQLSSSPRPQTARPASPRRMATPRQARMSDGPEVQRLDESNLLRLRQGRVSESAAHPSRRSPFPASPRVSARSATLDLDLGALRPKSTRTPIEASAYDEREMLIRARTTLSEAIAADPFVRARIDGRHQLKRSPEALRACPPSSSSAASSPSDAVDARSPTKAETPRKMNKAVTSEVVRATPNSPAAAVVSMTGVHPELKTPHTNQDTWLAHADLGRGGSTVIGVFDGHGEHGAAVAERAAELLPRALLEDARFEGALQDTFDFGELHAFFVSAFQQVDALLTAGAASEVALSGCTSTICCFRGRHVLTSFVGTCRAVLLRVRADADAGFEAIDLSTDHKPSDPVELERIRAFGGRVDRSESDPLGPHRVFGKHEHVTPGISCSRSIGDTVAHQLGVVCDPDVTVHQILAGDRAVLLGTEGFWLHLSSHEAAHLAHAHWSSTAPASQDPLALAQTLAAEARRRARASSGAAAVDDVTVAVVLLQAPRGRRFSIGKGLVTNCEGRRSSVSMPDPEVIHPELLHF